VSVTGELVLLDLDPASGLAHIRLNRPESSNALNTELLAELHEALTRAQDARAVLLTGEGKNFCAGGDVKAFAAQEDRLPEYIREATARLNDCARALIGLAAPVVTAVQGWATGGGGVGLVCASDLVLAAESARFMLGATRVGMAPDAGATVTLAHHIGLRRAMELALTNRVLLAREALEFGLVTTVVSDDELQSRAMEVATELAAGPTEAQAATKRLIWEGIGARVEERLESESKAVTELSGTPEALARLRAVIERAR
jgi:2-(1,2-epoxy-1,2-dihydrophenyl)acetyl-CoA isomerase